jgi:hypothetical protein
MTHHRSLAFSRVPPRRHALFLAVAICLLSGCAAQGPAAQSRPSGPADSPDWWRQVTLSLHGRQIPSDDSFAVIVPRNDIDLESDMGQIPISAGIASRFYFFRCPCGKVKTLGEFVVCDYEANDVLDAIRAGKFDVVSLSPILHNTRPSMVSIHFQGEGDAEDIVKTLRKALDQTGRIRSDDGADGTS